MEKAIEANQKVDKDGAKIYYAMYKASKNSEKRKRAPTPQEWYK
jgi:hypothetical protein